MFCLDTNSVIAAITKRAPAVDHRLQAEFQRGTRVVVPAIVLFELRFGIIAAQARRRRAALVTANLREFRRVPGLLVQDWSAE